jgi:uncharacterized RDD family membrane protein YckC
MENYSNPKASAQHRLGGKAVDGAMYLVTLGIGWFIWSMVVWGQGQTPGKQILRMRVYDKTTGKPAKWGQMAIREFLLPLSFTIPFYVVAAVFYLDSNLATWLTGLVIMYVGITSQALGLVIMYVGILAITLTDAVWILRGTAKNRLVDVIAKTDVLNESPN